MSELEQVVEGLKELEGLGLPLLVEEHIPLFSNDIYHTFLLLPGSSEIRVTTDTDGPWDEVETLRGFLERQMEERGLWVKYLTCLNGRIIHKGDNPPVIERRPTLLEVINACREVLK